jgi:cyclic pyranopterin phosphate synthase
MSEKLSHTDGHGRARMVDVGEKKVTRRVARAEGMVKTDPKTIDLILNNDIPKGDLFAAARIAGIQAAKKTSELIPLCHILPLDSVSLEIEADRDQSALALKSEVTCTGRTGVEMEALTAVSAAALTIYDMCKSVDRGIEIMNIRLSHKSGGKSGTWDRPEYNI